MKHFRTNHLPNSEHLALITEKGYGADKYFNQSMQARKFLKWYAHSNNLPVRDSESENWEKKIGPYYVDGFVKKEDRPIGEQVRDLAIEFHG
jgi:hypothetical protein